MCGIAGFFAPRPVEESILTAMHAAIGPRGPDARHAVRWDAAAHPVEANAHTALLHTRLSIRDLRAVADQPMRNADGSVWICYNGEVYGWENDAAQLKRDGYVFHTTGDTEFILHGYQAWGLDGLLPRLRGMFAIALLDWKRQQLILIRDRMGIKPIVYYHGDSEFAFGSTVRSVLPFVPASQRRLSPEALDAYLAHRYVPAPMTVFTTLQRLPHGHVAIYDLREHTLTLKRYWQPRPDAGDDFNVVLDEAVRLRTVSDRPVGLFLSGGVDSATVASILKRHHHDDITAYTAAFPGTAFDETPQAARIAARLGMRHEQLPVESDIGADFERLVADLDEPFADPSSIPLWYLARAAAQRVRVVMGGDGGDELFAGYKRYAKHLRTTWRRGLRLPLPRRAPGQPGRLAKILDELALPWDAAYSLRFSGFAPAWRRALQPGFASPRAVYWDNMPSDTDDALGTLLEIDMDNYLPEYILRKADLCTMAHGLELRVPLLDHVLYQTVLALPTAQRFTQPAKRALASACAVCDEEQLFDAPKRGFNPPLAPWLKGELRRYTDGLGPTLQELTGGQIATAPVDGLVARFAQGETALAEQLLQLILLRVSLTQLRHGPTRVH
jgi:asparagine synthase (glutamine-hydrolysing)